MQNPGEEVIVEEIILSSAVKWLLTITDVLEVVKKGGQESPRDILGPDSQKQPQQQYQTQSPLLCW